MATFYLNKVVDSKKGWLLAEDSKENILHDLENYTLDPVFENYGNFVYKPRFTSAEHEQHFIEMYGENMTCISGNFLKLSHAFRVVTDDQELIKELETAIRRNQQAIEYEEAI